MIAEEKKLAIMRLARENLSAAEIGAYVGLSRNSVLGWCWRNGISLGNDPAKHARRVSEGLAVRGAKPKTKVARKVARKVATQQERNIAKLEKEMQAREKKRAQKSLNVPMSKLNENGCRFPTNSWARGKAGRALFCGLMSLKDHPYCLLHMEITTPKFKLEASE